MSLFHASRREKSGAKPSQLRKQGIIPMGLVERSHETLPLQIPKAHFKEAMSHGGHTHVDVQIEGEAEARKAILKNIDYDSIRREIVHITLQEVSDEDQIKLDVPVVGVGTNEDSKAAGVTLTQALDHLKLRGRADQMPERIEVDISGLHAGQSLTAAEIPLPEGIELLSPSDAIVFGNTIDKEPELTAEPTEMEASGVPTDSDAVDASSGS